MSPYQPVGTPRTSLIDLPYYMREVAQLVDHFRAQAQTEQLRDEKEQRKSREMLEKAGIPT